MFFSIKNGPQTWFFMQSLVKIKKNIIPLPALSSIF